MEPVIDGALTIGFGVPGSQGVLHPLPVLLYGEVDDGGGAAPGRSPGAGLEGVRCERPTEGQLHVGVNIDAAGDDVLPLRVEDLLSTRGEIGAEGGVSGCHDRGNRLAVDEDIGLVATGRRDDGAVLDQDRHGSSSSLTLLLLVLELSCCCRAAVGPLSVSRR